MKETKLNYEEAKKLAIASRWKIQDCHQEKCWCVMIVPETPIEYQSDGGLIGEYYVIGSGEVCREIGERIVKDHNDSLEK